MEVHSSSSKGAVPSPEEIIEKLAKRLFDPEVMDNCERGAARPLSAWSSLEVFPASTSP
jgi:hypothetical protein